MGEFTRLRHGSAPRQPSARGTRCHHKSSDDELSLPTHWRDTPAAGATHCDGPHWHAIISGGSGQSSKYSHVRADRPAQASGLGSFAAERRTIGVSRLVLSISQRTTLTLTESKPSLRPLSPSTLPPLPMSQRDRRVRCPCILRSR